MKKLGSIMLILAMVVALSACDFMTEADKVNSNLNTQAGYFGCERRVTVYNAWTDTIILEVEGYMDISNNGHSELVVTCKTGESEYKKNYIYLNDFVLYTVEDITGVHTDPYHYKMVFHTEWPTDIELKP